jgi:hypothetical protein
MIPTSWTTITNAVVQWPSSSRARETYVDLEHFSRVRISAGVDLLGVLGSYSPVAYLQYSLDGGTTWNDLVASHTEAVALNQQGRTLYGSWGTIAAGAKTACTLRMVTSGGSATGINCSGYFHVCFEESVYVGKVLEIPVSLSSEVCGVADGTCGVLIPALCNGWNVTAVVAGVATKGVTGAMDVQVRRVRAGTPVDVLSTKVTVGDEYFAADGVINASNDDVATGDMLYIDVDAVHTTPAYGLTVAITIEPVSV